MMLSRRLLCLVLLCSAMVAPGCSRRGAVAGTRTDGLDYQLPECKLPILTQCAGPATKESCECKWACDRGKGAIYQIDCTKVGSEMTCHCQLNGSRKKSCTSNLGDLACNKNNCCGYPVGAK
jgi:hypothetical protein